MWTACVLTLYPEMFPGPLGASLAGQALAAQRWQLDAINIRDYAKDRHRTVDDTPAGGGPGMVMRADVLGAAIDGARGAHPALPLIYPSPRGKLLTQARIRELSAGSGMMLLCGRFEGVDQRVIEVRQAEEICIGDYILSGGELAAMVMIDAAVRLLPGVMGAENSGEEESFENGLLEYPHYTRPREWEGREIPEVLLSGNHERIAAWRTEQSRQATQERRPDLIARENTDKLTGKEN
ncbi:MAG TPA: tRNA (guanosine(37)-N1)-methyltransferase TrmD [Hyphomicrobiales bacterium]|nr:tRNA (guanosine(37)-N1)-methyltransferase TrmD [Hyphomicrobiales bacterium]